MEADDADEMTETEKSFNDFVTDAIVRKELRKSESLPFLSKEI